MNQPAMEADSKSFSLYKKYEAVIGLEIHEIGRASCRERV